MKYVKLLSVLSLFVFLNAACYYDVEEELYPVNTCDTTSVTYAVTVQNIIQENCYVCHSAASQQGGVILEGYTALKGYVDSGQLLGAIKQNSGFSPMPQGQPKLDDCTILKVETWITGGALDN